jgi:hypothetical protein
VSRSECEALKRFPDYNRASYGTLMRIEGDIEFRIYREDVERCPLGVVTEGVLNLFADLCDDAPREAGDASEQGASLPDNVTAGPRKG